MSTTVGLDCLQKFLWSFLCVPFVFQNILFLGCCSEGFSRVFFVFFQRIFAINFIVVSSKGFYNIFLASFENFLCAFLWDFIKDFKYVFTSKTIYYEFLSSIFLKDFTMYFCILLKKISYTMLSSDFLKNFPFYFLCSSKEIVLCIS